MKLGMGYPNLNKNIGEIVFYPDSKQGEKGVLIGHLFKKKILD